MALIGYARVSTGEQLLDLQIDALNKAGVKQIYTDQISGSVDSRVGLTQALDALHPGDCLVVWRLDRLGRSVAQLISVVDCLRRRQVDFRSLTEAIDSGTSAGRMTFVIFSALAEFERDLIRARTVAGLEAARLRGRIGGRPPKLGQEQIQMLHQLLLQPENTVSSVARALGIDRSSVYRILRKNNQVN